MDSDDIAAAWQQELDARTWRNRANASTQERDRLARELATAQAAASNADGARFERDALLALVIVIVVLVGLIAVCVALAAVNGGVVGG